MNERDGDREFLLHCARKLQSEASKELARSLPGLSPRQTLQRSKILLVFLWRKPPIEVTITLKDSPDLSQGGRVKVWLAASDSGPTCICPSESGEKLDRGGFPGSV